MVLRSGVIIPFQFRDNKKLLTVGVPEDDRDISIWDLKNVVRSAFGICNFEFRNKKIGFNIPDDLLLNYLSQRHDLTNFVIEIVQAVVNDNTAEKLSDGLSYEPSCSTQSRKVPPSQIPDESSNIFPAKQPVAQGYKAPDEVKIKTENTPTVQLTHDGPPETLRQSSDAMEIIPKLEQSESDQEMPNDGNNQQLQHFPNLTRSVPDQLRRRTSDRLHRRRAMRMSKQQKMMYVKFFEENRCMLATRRNERLMEPFWLKLCNMLNSVPRGAVKNVDEWKQTFDAWRYRVFMYIRYNSRLAGAAARNPKIYKPLTPIDLRAYLMWIRHRHITTELSDHMIQYSHVDDSLDLSGCVSGLCLALHKSNEDITPSRPHSNQRRARRSSSSIFGSPTAGPEYKMRREERNSNEMVAETQAETTESEFIHLQPKVEYECVIDEDDAITTSAAGAAAYQSDAPGPELHLDAMRMHHEYYLQQQQHHHQQQQLQQSMEGSVQERATGGLRQRKERMSRKQKEIYVNYLERTPIMTEHKRNDPVLDKYWQDLTDILNSTPQGAAKSVSEWKQAFDNWRFRIFLYARYNSKITGDAALNAKNFKPLTLTDKRAYSLWIRNADTAPPDLDQMRNIFVNIDETPPE